MPVVTTFPGEAGVINGKWLASKRKWADSAGFCAGGSYHAHLGPVNQTLVAAPLVVLYELSIWLARIFRKK